MSLSFASPTPSASPARRSLSARQLAVLRAVGRGLDDQEIASALGLSGDTVTRHVRAVLDVLGLRDRCAAIVYAFDHGIVTPRHRAALARDTVSSRPAEVTGPRLELGLLGPLHARSGSVTLDLGPLRQQAVLAALASRCDHTVSSATLLADVWGTEPPLGNVVPVYVYRLRRGLRCGNGAAESVIARDRCGYRLLGADVRLDTTRLDAVVAEAGAALRAGDLATAVAEYSRALGLFRGEPLAGLPGPFAELERLRLTERRSALSQRKAELQLSLGRQAEAVDELQSSAALFPHSEPVVTLLMRALHEQGRSADALAAFTRLRRALATDLGVEPGAAARRIHRAILRDRARPADPVRCGVL
ncbi:transcriptional regulator [Saccharomonospora piscinae]|uniref:BTAD domain-containing putative transcriptional regulator n=1 Tax=Saccharomonospora piscinae TaxID=687388 RepID=UPI001106BFA8|nr:BTAD domain-containing putative transcriptional regulator [Saccharomonospora piscinae]TLW91002.1 transcriptional regulator [Saccharomonospora piscinae]